MGFDRFGDKIGKTEYYKKKYFGEKVSKMENVNLTRKVVNLEFFPQRAKPKSTIWVFIPVSQNRNRRNILGELYILSQEKKHTMPATKLKWAHLLSDQIFKKLFNQKLMGISSFCSGSKFELGSVSPLFPAFSNLSKNQEDILEPGQIK